MNEIRYRELATELEDDRRVAEARHSEIMARLEEIMRRLDTKPAPKAEPKAEEAPPPRPRKASQL